MKPEAEAPAPAAAQDNDAVIDLDADFARPTDPVPVPSVRPPPMYEVRLFEDADLLNFGDDLACNGDVDGEGEARTTRPEQIVPPPEARRPTQRRRPVDQVRPFGDAITEPPPVVVAPIVPAEKPPVAQPARAPVAQPTPPARVSATFSVPPSMFSSPRAKTFAGLVAGALVGAALMFLFSQHQAAPASSGSNAPTRADSASAVAPAAPRIESATPPPAAESATPPAPSSAPANNSSAHPEHHHSSSSRRGGDHSAAENTSSEPDDEAPAPGSIRATLR